MMANKDNSGNSEDLDSKESKILDSWSGRFIQHTAQIGGMMAAAYCSYKLGRSHTSDEAMSYAGLVAGAGGASFVGWRIGAERGGAKLRQIKEEGNIIRLLEREEFSWISRRIGKIATFGSTAVMGASGLVAGLADFSPPVTVDSSGAKGLIPIVAAGVVSGLSATFNELGGRTDDAPVIHNLLLGLKPETNDL
jgi:hypothetical protein